MRFYVVAILVIILDQVSKYLVRMHVELHESFTWFGIEFKYIENSGMAGGLLPGYARIFGVISVFFVLFVFHLRRNKEWRGPIVDLSFGFLIGGAIGNGMDRLLYGQVTDFIRRGDGILNIADHALEIGIVLLIIHELLQWWKRKRSDRHHEELG